MSSLPPEVPSKLPPIVGRLERGEKTPICVIMVGMAGSGKTTLLTQLHRSKAPYCVNLDPATLSVPYDVQIDIRDTVNYKQVMKEHKLGPNGAIMTSLNLFATKFDQVMNILEKRAYTNVTTADDDINSTSMDYILVDTPGQIEAFTWSASGSIISESLASAFPTVLCFVVDTVRCASSPNTFMSTMLYACSMLYRTRLPLVVCFNKTDVVAHEFCMEWMTDYQAFQQALDNVSESAGFYGSLTRSLSLVLDEFYSSFANACGVSAVTGDGVDVFWETIEKAARQDFATDYVDDLKNRIEEQEARQRAIARHGVRRLQEDLNDEDDEE
jgi:GTPase SAR1 family protein